MSDGLDFEVELAPRVLVLDDDSAALEEIQEILELDDVPCVGATTADVAEQILVAMPSIEAVVTDVHLTRRDGTTTSGVEFVAEMRQRLTDRNLTFIVLSGDPSAVISSYESGAVDFLTKPLAPEDLLQALRDLGAAPAEDETTELLLRKVEETTRSLQKAQISLAQRELELSVSAEDYERQRLQGGKLREGLANGHLQPWFQPQVCLRTGRLLGFEALVRWLDPTRGMQNPAEFLPLADEIGLMAELDTSVQKQAFKTLSIFHELGIGECEIGINVTAAQLACPDFADQFSSVIERAGLRNSHVSVEVLESTMLDDAAAQPIKDNIEAIADLGIGVELDDFGTGHAGLSSLRDLTVSRIKIDRSFVSNVHLDPKLQKFTRALIALAKTLDVGVLAEGVETQDELEWLWSEGCDAVQGYYIAKPMPEHDAIDWSRSWRSGDALPRLMSQARVQ